MAPGPLVLVQRRAAWTHCGGLWGLPGGARDSQESVPAAALREAEEEAGPVTLGARVVGILPGTDHGTWRYQYVVAVVDVARTPVTNAESDEMTWVDTRDVADLELLAPLAADWTRLRAAAESAAGQCSTSSSNSPTSLATASDSIRNPS